MAEWSLDEPTVLDLDEVVRTLDVRLVAGSVDVVGTDDDSVRVELTEIDGPPLRVRIDGGRLTVAHDDPDRRGLLGWRLITGRRRAVVSVAVPRSVDTTISVVSADAVLAGLQGRAKVRCVSGDVVLDALAGDVEVESVSGDVEGRGLAGSLTLKAVSGGLTVVDGTIDAVRARTVSGDVALDVGGGAARSFDLTTVSGDLTVRLPADAGLAVDVSSTSGSIDCAFDGVATTSRPGGHKLHGQVGDGSGQLRGRTVSGRFALLAREPA